MVNIASSDVPTDGMARLQWIMANLKLRGTSMSEVARKLGIHRNVVRQAIFAPSFRAEAGLADALGLPIESLFPERYRNGKRIHLVRGPNPTKGAERRNNKGHLNSPTIEAA